MKKVEHTLNIGFEQILALVAQCTDEERRLLLQELVSNTMQVGLASEKSLAKDWLSKEEDEAWKDL